MSGYRNPMNLKNCCLCVVAALFAWALLCSCASREPVPLPAEVRETKGLAVGVAFGRICQPEMQIEGLPVRGMGPQDSSPNVFGRRDERYWGSRHPILLSDKRRLEGYLQAGEADVFREIEERLAKELSVRGWNAVVLRAGVNEAGLPRFEGSGNGYAERDYRGAAPGAGLDALMVIDCRWYGVYCHYTGYYHQDFTDAAARFEGRMIDLGTNRLLWRSKEIRVRNPVPCRCNEPEDFACIDTALHAAAYEAASALLDELSESEP